MAENSLSPRALVILQLSIANGGSLRVDKDRRIIFDNLIENGQPLILDEDISFERAEFLCEKYKDKIQEELDRQKAIRGDNE